MYTIEAHHTFNRNVQHWHSIEERELKQWLKILRGKSKFGNGYFYLRWKITRDADGVVIAQWHHGKSK